MCVCVFDVICFFTHLLYIYAFYIMTGWIMLFWFIIYEFIICDHSFITDAWSCALVCLFTNVLILTLTLLLSFTTFAFAGHLCNLSCSLNLQFRKRGRKCLGEELRFNWYIPLPCIVFKFIVLFAYLHLLLRSLLLYWSVCFVFVIFVIKLSLLGFAVLLLLLCLLF